MLAYKQFVRDSKLEPNYENVATMFLTKTLYDSYFDPSFPDFKFKFTEPEAINEIDRLLRNYTRQCNTTSSIVKATQTLAQLRMPPKPGDTTPTFIVNNYRQFMNNLIYCYRADIPLHLKSTFQTEYPDYQAHNFLKNIWLRAQPEDYNHPENFLRDQYYHMNDSSLEHYDTERILGSSSYLKNHVIGVTNGYANSWDESARQFEVRIYDKKDFRKDNEFRSTNYVLPFVRYGISEKNGRKVCTISSIQNLNFDIDETTLTKNIERAKYKLNKNVPEEQTKIEPKSLLALSIFINVLNKEGIYDIEVPSLYVLDHEYHTRREPELLKNFNSTWNNSSVDKNSQEYKEAVVSFNRNYGKADQISRAKSEGFLGIFDRLLYHYDKGHVQAYPGDVDNKLHIHIPKLHSKRDVQGPMMQEMFDLVDTQYRSYERER